MNHQENEMLRKKKQIQIQKNDRRFLEELCIINLCIHWRYIVMFARLYIPTYAM